LKGAHGVTKRYVPDGKVAKERYGICLSTLYRWDHDEHLGFPVPIRINGRKYRDEAELDAFDKAQRARSEP
jgi:hypothetical protein